MFNEINAAISSIKAVSEIAKSAHDLSNYNELASAISEVNAKLLDAIAVALASQEKQSSLASRISYLENKLREVENWESKINRYRLYEFSTGSFAYVLKESMDDGEPIHYLCAKCVNDRKPTILQPNGNYLNCSVCETQIMVEHPAPPKRRRSSSWV